MSGWESASCCLLAALMHVRACLGAHLVTSVEPFLVGDRERRQPQHGHVVEDHTNNETDQSQVLRICHQHVVDILYDQNNISPWWVGKKFNYFILLIQRENIMKIMQVKICQVYFEMEIKWLYRHVCINYRKRILIYYCPCSPSV